MLNYIVKIMFAYCLYFSTNNNFGQSKKSKAAGREKHGGLIDYLLSESKVLLTFRVAFEFVQILIKLPWEIYQPYNFRSMSSLPFWLHILSFYFFFCSFMYRPHTCCGTIVEKVKVVSSSRDPEDPETRLLTQFSSYP